jgi:hypothetical protein
MGALGLLAVVGTVPACQDVPLDHPAPATAPTLTVDASQSWAYVRLGDSAQVIRVAQPRASTEWDLAFYATSVVLNGGAAGPSQVVGACLCLNQNLPLDRLRTLTPDNQLASFLAADERSLPAADTAWKQEVLRPAIDGWYRYDAATHTVTPAADRTWKVRLADGVAYAKLRVIAIDGATRTSPGRVTLEYAVQASAQEGFGPTTRRILDPTVGHVFLDLRTGTPGSGGGWDLWLDGYALRLNGGVSGSGRAAAALADRPYEDVISAADLPPQAYASDTYGGVFATHRWYRYNITGTDHQIWPTYDIYFVRRGAAVWKIQIIGYYNDRGEPRFVTFRYARLRG